MKQAILVAMLTITPAAVQAQELFFNPAPIIECMARAGDQSTRHACIGLGAEACMRATPGGDTTIGMSGCFDAELQWWDDMLNFTYQELMREAGAMDAEAPDYAPEQAPALRDMQRAWITFRDAKCSYERSQWGGGTGGGPATAACLMQETAEQVLYLEASRLGG